jgi:hypothetical protein
MSVHRDLVGDLLDRRLDLLDGRLPHAAVMTEGTHLRAMRRARAAPELRVLHDPAPPPDGAEAL